MHETRFFNKMVPASDGAILFVSGGNPNGFVLNIQNLDSLATMVYHVQESTDGGTTWEDLEFPISEGTASVFSIIAGNGQTIKVTSTSPLIRVMAYGDLEIAASIVSFRNSPIAAGTPVSVVL